MKKVKWFSLSTTLLFCLFWGDFLTLSKIFADDEKLVRPKIQAFTNGNAFDFERSGLSIFNTDRYYISPDFLSLKRDDQQLEITSSYVYQDHEENENNEDMTSEELTSPEHKGFVRYNGQEESRFLERDLLYSPSDLRFTSSNMAVWLGKTVDKVMGYGHLKKNPMKIKVYGQCKDMLNAYFDPTNNIICIGHLYNTLGRNALQGMGSLALDADVVVHELGHGILHHIVPAGDNQFFSFGSDMYGAMNEGQADFFAHVITGTVDMAPWMISVMKEYYKVKIPQAYARVKDRKALRVINNEYNLQKHYFGEIHEDGNIFSGVLYDLSTIVGKEVAFTLWLETLARTNESYNFYDYAQTLVEVDKDLYQEAHKFQILKAFKNRGIVGNHSIADARLTVKSTLIDDKTMMMKVLKSFNISDEGLDELIGKNNGNGQLEAGECGTIEFQFVGRDERSFVGVELFIPNTSLPAGLKNYGQNRFYLGKIPSGATVPEQIELDNRLRPWMLVCATQDMKDAKFPIVLKSASEGAKRIIVPVNAEREGLVD